MKLSLLASILFALSFGACVPGHVNAVELNAELTAPRILDVSNMDWDDSWAGLNGTSQGKLLYSGGGSLMLVVSFNPGWDAVNKSRHYTTFTSGGMYWKAIF